ncbi:MAG: histone deacetylase family protein [Pseudomonadota bacterium]
MTTLFITHPVCIEHLPNPGHPECPERLEAIEAALAADKEFSKLKRKTARRATLDDLKLAHGEKHIRETLALVPEIGLNFLDGDTPLSPQSGEAALHAAGAVLDAVDALLSGEASSAFCAVRPPGHHAHRDNGGGFCLFNNVAVGALAALKRHDLSRVAVVDFDVHHGNGTQDIARDEPGIFYASTHQSPFYPFTGKASETGRFNNILNIPLPAHSGGGAVRKAMLEKIIPRLDAFAPEIIFVSAGFDAHRDDPLGGLGWTEEDYAALMTMLLDATERHCNGRLVAVLEGGYNLAALGRSVAACLRVMMQRKSK